MFNENFKTIQRWFKNNKYDLINCSASQKNKYEEMKKQKIEEITRDENISKHRKKILEEMEKLTYLKKIVGLKQQF